MPFSGYRIRNAIGIERFVNLVCIGYAVVHLLPYCGGEFAQYQEKVPRRHVIRVEKRSG